MMWMILYRLNYDSISFISLLTCLIISLLSLFEIHNLYLNLYWIAREDAIPIKNAIISVKYILSISAVRYTTYPINKINKGVPISLNHDNIIFLLSAPINKAYLSVLTYSSSFSFSLLAIDASTARRCLTHRYGCELPARRLRRRSYRHRSSRCWPLCWLLQ